MLEHFRVIINHLRVCSSQCISIRWQELLVQARKSMQFKNSRQVTFWKGIFDTVGGGSEF